MGLVAPLPERKITRRAWARGWYRISRDTGCSLRFSIGIAILAWIDGPSYPLTETVPQRNLVMSQQDIDAQREGAWLQ